MRSFRVFLIVFLSLVSCAGAQGRIAYPRYGVSIEADSATIARSLHAMTDNIVMNHPMMTSRMVISDIELPHAMAPQTADFYLLLLLCLLLGMIRFMDTRYFVNLWRAFWNPT